MRPRGRIFINGLLFSFAMALLCDGALGASAPLPANSFFLDEETNVFLQAKTHIFERNWDRAVIAFQGYLKVYPRGRYGDEAGFWLAKALYGSAGEERTMERVLDRMTEAVEALSRLEKEHSASRWLEESRPFRKDLLTGIAVMGGDRSKDVLAGFLKEENKSMEQARLDGLDVLLDWDRGFAAPVIEDLLKTVANPEGRKSVVRFAARIFPDETETSLREAAARDADAGVRSEAAALLEKIASDRLPVDAAYYVFSARLKNEAQRAQLPENTAKVFELAPVSLPNNKDAEKMADARFGGKLRRLTLKGGGIIGRDVEWLRDLLGDVRGVLGGGLAGLRATKGKRVVAGPLFVESAKTRSAMALLRKKLSGSGDGSAVKVPVGDVTITFPLAGVRKTPVSVGGRLLFECDEKTYPADFLVEARHGQLWAFRRGDNVWLAVVMFRDAARDRKGPAGLRRERRSPLIFEDVMGCRIECAWSDWTIQDMSSRTLIDFGLAKAAIPGASGRWRLEGFLLADKTKKSFVGRDAELFDPTGKSVVRAAEVVVPVGAPEKYEIVKK